MLISGQTPGISMPPATPAVPAPMSPAAQRLTGAAFAAVALRMMDLLPSDLAALRNNRSRLLKQFTRALGDRLAGRNVPGRVAGPPQK